MLKLLFMVITVIIWLFTPIGIIIFGEDEKYGMAVVTSVIFFIGLIIIFVL